MSAPVWKAVKVLAEIWRTSQAVQNYASAALGWGAEAVYPSAHHIDAQPFYLCEYIHTRVSFENINKEPSPPPWIDDGVQLALAYTLLIETLRSRCSGYPFEDAPHLSHQSPWTRFTVSMDVPWLSATSVWKLHTRKTAPVFPVLGIPAELQYPAMAELMTAFIASPPVAKLEAAWKALSEADRAQLANARNALDRAGYPQRKGQTHGDEDFRYAAWAETQLDETIRALNGRARTFADALSKLDTFTKHIGALFSHLVFYKDIRRLDEIVLVEQLNGRHGWYTIRSDRYTMFSPIRQLEIVAFDYPYPRGLMVVEGVSERLPFGNPGGVTVCGPVLVDSEGAI